MASILAHIGSVRYVNDLPSGVKPWDGPLGFCANVFNYPIEDQFRLFTEQILAAVYFRVFYGRHCHYLVSEYVDELILAFLTRFYPAASREFIPGSDRARLLEQVANFVSYLQEGYWKRPPGDADELHNYMCAFPITVGPRVWDPEKYPNYLPLIAYLNTDAGKVVEGYSALGLTTFRFTGSVNYEPDASHGSNYIRLDSYNHPIGSSFSCEGTPCDKGNIEILRYLSHFNLSGVSIEKIFCSLLEMAFSLDIKRPGMSSTQIFCACLYASLNKVVTLSGTSRKGMTEVEKYAPGCYEETVKFLKYAVETYGVTVNIPLITTRFIFSLMDKAKQKDTVEKIHEAGGSASADNLATTESWWVSQEALQFISQKADNASTAQSQVAESKTSTTEKGNNTSQTTTTETKTESTQKTESQSNKDDDGGDDTTRDELTPGDDNSAPKGDDDANGSEANDDNSSGETGTSGEEPAATGDDMPPEDEQMRTSDEDGIRFSIANPDSETSDSVMWREEVCNFLSNILANPPEDLSPQDVATLTALQRFWLQHLSIETVVGILGSCLDRLPASLTKLISKIGDQKHE